MSRKGFILTKLVLKGGDVPNAEVHFCSGLNVICGPSDTGKTFILQCIDFALGSGQPPKEIPEATRYNSVYLSLRTREDNREYTIERSLRGGSIRLHGDELGERILKPKHQAGKEDSVSHFLLSLTGLPHKKVRTSKRGTTRTLSFRDLARLIIIDEETVISDKSPIHSGDYSSVVAETSIFRLLLTGVDDSSVIENEDPKITKGRRQGKNEAIDALLSRYQEQITALHIPGDIISLREQYESVDLFFSAASSELAIKQQSLATIEDRRRGLVQSLHVSESRMSVLSELQHRFNLLRAQYLSDLARLESVSEAGNRLGQLKEERCPVCGSLAEHHDFDHQFESVRLEDIALATAVETQKIHSLLGDLTLTLEDNILEMEQIGEQVSMQKADLISVNQAIQDYLHPRLQQALQQLHDAQEQRDQLRYVLNLYERVEECQNLLNDVIIPKKAQATDDSPVTITAHTIEHFSKMVETLLKDWHFPNLDRVIYSETDEDIIISGRRRASHGKGVRAITHAAFNLALLGYCTDAVLPHPGFLLIDSPLVVYREPDPDEGSFPLDVKAAFYETLSQSFLDYQVIVLENVEPPTDLSQSGNIIQFTGSHSGRKGFIPEDGVL